MNIETNGITIEFRGNSVQFSNTIDGINKALKLLSKDVKTLNKELKFDPTNAKLLATKFDELKEKQALLNEQLKKYNKAIANMGSINTSKDMAKLVEFQKGLADTETALRRLDEQITLYGVQSVANFGKELDETGNKLETIGKGIYDVGKSLAVFSAGATALLSVGVSYNAELEQIQIGFETITGSEEDALAVMQEIRKEAEKTPFGVQDLMQYNRMLMATGVSAEESQKVITALGNAISATGGSSYEFERMVQNLQQIKQAGQSTARDIKQFAYAYIDIYGMLSDYLGVNASELEASKITFEQIAGALEYASSEGGKYYGAMEKQSQSLSGQTKKVKDDFSVMCAELTESLMPAIEEIIADIREFTKSFAELSEHTRTSIANILVVTALISPLLLGIGKIVETIGKLSVLAGSFLQSEWMLTTLTALKGSVMSLLAPIMAIVGAVVLLIESFRYQYETSETFREKLAEFGDSIKSGLLPILTSLKNIFVTIGEGLKKIFEPVIKSVGIIIEGTILPLLKTLWELISAYILPILTSLGDLLGGVLGTAFQLIADVVGVVCIAIEGLVGIIQIFLNSLAGSQMWQDILNFLQNVVDFVTTIVNGLKEMFDWITSILEKGGDLIGQGIGGIASWFNQGSGGFNGMNSGGFSSNGFNTNVTINVNSNNITKQEVLSWADLITERVNENLGGMI